ncbi:TPA: hypothetical protein N0F65_009415 [Lagenidium giganteum]|uniref:mRNA capping enzyme adenylation domain-containing protein n=1 Tax=Lagenidium giganteum TaxID=4803 RepID=A0AAV2ZGG1_9STRA|nr:TPA: hypothetical protein N0F65_009415 [Lagenidium giganteum]
MPERELAADDRAAIADKLRRAGGATKKQGDGGRKLLHWTPQQWKEFERAPQHCKRVASAKLVPIRAPLSSIYEIHYGGNGNYTPSALMEKLISSAKSGNVISIGLVVDATGDDSFLYDQREWDDWDVQYVKLPVQRAADVSGNERAELDDRLLSAFFTTMEKHGNGEMKDMDVAVYGYGASGYNTVGFLIVSYLVEYCNLNLDSAIKEFTDSCPSGIYSRYYVERLYRKYYSTLPSSTSHLSCPAPPGWDSEAADDSSAKIGPDVLTDADKAHVFVRKQRRPSSTATTPVGNGRPTYTPPVYKPPMYIPPDREDLNTRSAKRRKIRSWVDEVEPLSLGETLDTSSEEHERITKALEKLTGVEGFPGCEAVSLTATHTAEGAYKQKGCLSKAYLVTWRARGRRCMLFAAADGTYLVSRDMSLTKVNVKFARRRAPAEAQVNTLIDGILVEDQDHDTKVSRFLAFDIVFLEGTPIWQKKLEKRLQCLQNEVILPRKNDKSFDYNLEPFRLRMKDHFRLQKTEYLLQKFVQSITHEVDGVIYTPTEAAYSVGGFESEEPIFKFVASECGSGIPGLDGSISERRLLQYIQSIPQK